MASASFSHFRDGDLGPVILVKEVRSSHVSVVSLLVLGAWLKIALAHCAQRWCKLVELTGSRCTCTFFGLGLILAVVLPTSSEDDGVCPLLTVVLLLWRLSSKVRSGQISL